jgi:uncharacterized protein YpbB
MRAENCNCNFQVKENFGATHRNEYSDFQERLKELTGGIILVGNRKVVWEGHGGTLAAAPIPIK